MIEPFIFDPGPENGATRTSCGPGREGHAHVHELLSFIDPCGFVSFWGAKFSFKNWKHDFQSRSIHIFRLVRINAIFGKFVWVRMRGSSGEVGAGKSSGHAGSRFDLAVQTHKESVRQSARKKTPSVKALRNLAARASPKGVEDGVFEEEEEQPSLTSMLALNMDWKGALPGPSQIQARNSSSGQGGSNKIASVAMTSAGVSTSEGVSEEKLQVALAAQARAFAFSMQEARREERKRTEAVAALQNNKFVSMTNSLDALSRLVRQQLATAGAQTLPVKATPVALAAAAECETPARAL